MTTTPEQVIAKIREALEAACNADFASRRDGSAEEIRRKQENISLRLQKMGIAL